MDELLDSLLVLLLILATLIAAVWFAAGTVWLIRRLLDRLIEWLNFRRFSSRWR